LLLLSILREQEESIKVVKTDANIKVNVSFFIFFQFVDIEYFTFSNRKCSAKKIPINQAAGLEVFGELPSRKEWEQFFKIYW
jgi:hypothetical protein